MDIHLPEGLILLIRRSPQVIDATGVTHVTFNYVEGDPAEWITALIYISVTALGIQEMVDESTGDIFPIEGVESIVEALQPYYKDEWED